MTPSEFFAAFTWRDALDFGLLFFIFYGALRLLRGTRAVPVLLSVAFLPRSRRRRGPSISSPSPRSSATSSSTSSSS